MSSQPKELREAYAQFDASHPWPTLHEAYIHAWHAAIAALGAQKPVAYVGKNSQLFSVALHDSLAEVREGSAGYSLLKELRPLFAAPVLPSVKEGWQPIETAPKGELIAIWIAGTNKFGERWSETIGECWLYCYYDSICGEWRTTRPSGHLRCAPERFVTHWMHTPAAPSPQEEKK